jgi:AmmeMemoRadiSam system protein B
MLRSPAVAGTFYPASPQELAALIHSYTSQTASSSRTAYRACLVPHAGYVYSGRVAGAVYERIAFPRRIIVLGVRHFPYGEEAAILSDGAWRTPLGDAPIDSELAVEILRSCPALVEDAIAHESEHSLEVQIPFLQVLAPGFAFVPIALGTLDFAALQSVGAGLAQVLAAHPDVMVVATTDLNHYENEATTLRKDQLAIDKILARDSEGLFRICREHNISMCGLGPVVALLTALSHLGVARAELVMHSTSADYSGDKRRVVGYAGFLFS